MDSDSSGDEAAWEECEDEEEMSQDKTTADCLCLFCELSLESCQLIFVHCKLKHDVDVLALVHQRHFDCIEYIKMINYVRGTVSSTQIVNCN